MDAPFSLEISTDRFCLAGSIASDSVTDAVSIALRCGLRAQVLFLKLLDPKVRRHRCCTSDDDKVYQSRSTLPLLLGHLEWFLHLKAAAPSTNKSMSSR